MVLGPFSRQLVFCLPSLIGAPRARRRTPSGGGPWAVPLAKPWHVSARWLTHCYSGSGFGCQLTTSVLYSIIRTGWKGLMARRHPNKEVRIALEYAESRGWRVESSGGSSHAWGRIYCPYNNPACRCGEFCKQSIWSTPRNPGNYAKIIRRLVDNCSGPHRREDEEDDV